MGTRHRPPGRRGRGRLRATAGDSGATTSSIARPQRSWHIGVSGLAADGLCRGCAAGHGRIGEPGRPNCSSNPRFRTDRGFLFVYLPVSLAERGRRASARVRVRCMSERLPVLIVDHYEDARELYAAYLTHVGYDVSTAAEGNAALRCALQGTCDVIVLDVALPTMDGMTILRLLRANPKTKD